MKIVEPKFEILEQDGGGLSGALKHIERVGRVCYKSEDKITEDSYKKFVAMLENKGHGAMLEHGTVYLAFPEYKDRTRIEQMLIDIFTENHYSCVSVISDNEYVTTNYRVIFEENLKDAGFLNAITPYISDCYPQHMRRVSAKFTCDRGVSHEFVRNRGRLGNAFAQESTRYCDYNKGEGVAYCRPVWLAPEQEPDFVNALENNERLYSRWRETGWQPQQARGFLNHFLKTELIITAMMSDWEHFFSLRADSHAHPSAQQLAYPLKEEFVKRKWIDASPH